MAPHDPIPAEVVIDALRSWPVDVVDVRPIPPGATADVFLVRDRSGCQWVAKYTYETRRYVEAGLAVSEVIDVGGWAVARRVRTGDGARCVMVEWPSGVEHPLALLSWVPGESMPDGWDGWPELSGTVCGRVHAALLRSLDPVALGVDVAGPVVPELLNGWDVGPLTWLDDLAAELPGRARAAVARSAGGVRIGHGVWDGPDIRVVGGDVVDGVDVSEHAIGLIDFGHTSWQPLVHVVANRSLVAAYEDEARLARFLAAVEAHLELTAAEHDALPLFRVLNATIYARYMARQRVQRGPAFSAGDAAWLERLLSYLRADLPRLGLTAGPG